MKNYLLLLFFACMHFAIFAEASRGLSLGKISSLLQHNNIGIGDNSITIAVEKKPIPYLEITLTKQYDFYPNRYTIQVIWQNKKKKKILHSTLHRKLYKNFTYDQVKDLVDLEIETITSF